MPKRTVPVDIKMMPKRTVPFDIPFDIKTGTPFGVPVRMIYKYITFPLPPIL